MIFLAALTILAFIGYWLFIGTYATATAVQRTFRINQPQSKYWVHPSYRHNPYKFNW